MIYTLTANPAIDMNITVDKIIPNQVCRTDNTVYSANGKGLNVSYVLKHFGVESTILGFFGGFSGEYIIEHCNKNGYPIMPVKISGMTRINVFVNEMANEYSLVNKGPEVTDDEQNKMLDLLMGLDDIEYLTINGSLPRGIDVGYYDKIAKICSKKSVKLILDISTPYLKQLLKYKPFLIKPNDDEVRDIFGVDIKNENDVIEALRIMHGLGAENILLTMGAKGSYFSDGSAVYFCGSCPIKLKNSVCAGDSYLAAFMSEWIDKKNDVEESLKKASATGANVAESDGIGDLKNVESYSKKVNVRKVKMW